MDHLTTIPEDVSVAASADVNNPSAPRSITNLSTASAVASSDSGDYAVVDGRGGGGIAATAANDSRGGGGTRGKKRRQGSGVSTNAAVGGDGDNLSETHASLGGADGGVAGAGTAAGASSGADGISPQSRQKIEEAKKASTSSADWSWLLKCSKKSVIFYSIVIVLLIIMAVGIYFIVDVASRNSSSNEGNSTQIPEDSPTPDPQFPSFDFMESQFPTTSPSFNQQDVLEVDASLLKVDGTTEENLYNVSTPQGMSRYWLVHVDKEELRVGEDGESRVQQRYIACVLYYATNGPNWNSSNYLDPTLHECDWDGITCRGKDIALIILSSNNLSGTLPQELKSLTSLEALDLLDNSIGGTIPDGLFDSLRNLTWLDISKNQIEGTIPGFQGSLMPSVETIYCRKNLLEGTIPFFPNIQIVHAEENNLTSIDARYSTSAQSLTEFVAYDNRFSGPLPTVWNAPSLESFDVGLNGWTGTIPQGLWDLPSLKSLYIDNCDLTGQLPASTEGAAFEIVWLQSNRLSGPIPITFGTTWLQLNSLLLQDNQLSGSISEDHCDRWPLSTSGDTSDEWTCEADCNRTSMTCSCCTKCYPI